ncbi:MAG: putative monovalent cation/H+ antiporter subunit A [Planctomycetaceae bacterium]|nr:putative monovalent cation/H+ antiporter subunit A [Planctomycetaceae bacterium]
MMELSAAVLSGFAMAALAPGGQRVLGARAGWILALLPAGLAVYFARLLWHPDVRSGGAFRESTPWLRLRSDLPIDLSFAADGLSILFSLLICGIGALVVIYAGGYLAGHRRLGRFYLYLLAFMASMLGLVLADNLILLFIFWEATSLTSYLLIGFEHEREQARKAALQALLVTAGGGLALLPGLLLLGMEGNSFELSALRAEGDRLRESAFYLPILLLVLAGCFTKSAQFPFHFWLPGAMEAPTPVSAYLHSSTMVKVGIYFLARLSPILGGTPSWMGIVSTMGAATMIVGAYLSLRETYLKRILAYSTVSVLGVLVLLLGLSSDVSVKAALVFVLAHAMYKGALFLVAGAIDHETGERDVTRLGGLRRRMPLTAFAAMLAAWSMAGIVPMFGFIGKESLFEAVWNLLESTGSVSEQALLSSVAALLLAGSVLASMWLVAAAGLVSIKPFLGPLQDTPRTPHEAPLSLWLGPMLLAILGVLTGLRPLLVSEPLLSLAIAAVSGNSPASVDLALFHGVTPALILDLVVLTGGIIVYRFRIGILQNLAWLDRLLQIGPQRWYGWALDALTSVATWQTRVLQNGYLRFYLATIVLTTLALGVGAALQFPPDELEQVGSGPAGFRREARIDIVLFGLAGVILLAAATAIYSRSRLKAIAALGVVGYSVGVVFIFFGAPDVAMTQFIIESLLVIVLVLAFYHLPPFVRFSPSAARLRDLMVALTAGAAMTSLILVAGRATAPRPLSEWYAAHSVSDAHGRNIVNVILVDFRAFDTLGEIVVLATAGIGVYALLRLRPQ